jgi:putative ABC transport system permease protein
MLINHFLVALRSLRRRLGFAAINIAGLAIGITCCVVIALYVWGELSYDRFHEGADEIYRVESIWGEGSFSLPATNWRLVEALRSEYPELEAAHVVRASNQVIRRGDRMFREPSLIFTGPEFFDLFSFDLEQGSEAAALSEPNTIVLSRETARKYFGEEDPIGQVLTMFNDDTEFTVTGILASPRGPTHFPLNVLVSWETLEAAGWTAGQTWGNNSVNLYLRLPGEEGAERLAEGLPGVVGRHAGENWNGSVLGLQRLTDIHLHSKHANELTPGGNPTTVAIFAIVAIFILLLAGVNFVNLSTARSLERAREVGVRKSMGAREGQLARQFLIESVLIAFLGLVVAAVLLAIVIPVMAGLAGRPLVQGGRGIFGLALVGFVLTALVGILGGLYPAFALARFRPIEVLRGRFSGGRGGALVRKGLVVFQFTVAVVLLIGTFVVHGQLQHMRTADLGFDQAQVLALRGPGAPTSARLAFFDQMAAEPSVEGGAAVNQPMPSELLDSWGTRLPGAIPQEGDEEAFNIRGVIVSADFFTTLGARFLFGRDFRAGSASDSSGVIINETAARALMAQAPGRFSSMEALIGETVGGPQESQIMGIVDDFHMASLHRPMDAIAFYMGGAGVTYLVRVAPGRVPAALAAVQRHWSEHFPLAPLEYHFVDDAFGAAYRAEEQVSRLALLFAGLAILVACLGLFGLAAYAAEQRRKEIGVRKVLGAGVVSVMTLLSRDFVRLVAIAIVIGMPLAWLGVMRWLEGFPSRFQLGPEPFVAAGVLVIMIALLTVSGQAFRAAVNDPVRELRSE